MLDAGARMKPLVLANGDGRHITDNRTDVRVRWGMTVALSR
jgi:hypothetical protein